MTNEEKKPRLFMHGLLTNETWCFCGGPNPDEATKGVMAHLESSIEKWLKDGHTDDEIEFYVRMLTDAEVAQLPDI